MPMMIRDRAGCFGQRKVFSHLQAHAYHFNYMKEKGK